MKTRRDRKALVALLTLVTATASAKGQTFPGTANPNDPFEVHGKLYSGSAPAGFPMGDGWAQGASFLGVLDANGMPALDVNGKYFRASRTLDENWGNAGDRSDSSLFSSGNKNNFLIGPGQSPWNWDMGGGGPQKNDITNAYFHTRVDPLTGDRWVFVGGETRSTNGDSHVDFEFNHAGVVQTGTTSGQLIGLGPHGGRTIGDFLVSVDFESGGTYPVASVRVWNGTSFEVISWPGAVFSAANLVNIAHGAGGSWKHFASDGEPVNVLTALQFVEAGINLTALKIGVDPCATDATFTAKTRSSSSWTADLKDFVIVTFPLEPPPDLIAEAPERVCSGTTFEATVTEMTGLADPVFEWTASGCGRIVSDPTATTVTVEADPVCDCTIRLDVAVTAGECAYVDSVSVSVTVGDDWEPTMSGHPEDATVECDAIPTAPTITASDNCLSSEVSYEEEITPGTCVGDSLITRTWWAADDCNNLAEHVQLITVEDTTPPVLSGVPSDTAVSCDDIPEPAAPTATDNCSDPVIELDEVEVAGDCLGDATITRTWTATDACGNADIQSQVLSVTDQAPPELVGVPDDATDECDSLPPPAVVSATDNCSEGIVELDEEHVPGACLGQSDVFRTWTAVDDCGNLTSAVQHITLVDTTPPALYGVPADMSMECDAIAPPPDVTAGDNCSEPIVDYQEVNEPGPVQGEGTIRRTWRATDPCGNEASATQVIAVIDTTAPVLQGVPADVTVECDAVPQPPNVTATDNCAEPNVSLEESIESGPCNGRRTIRRTWTAVDAGGNRVSQTQVITVVDTTPPTFAGLPEDMTVECDAVPAPANVSATDNCSAPSVSLKEVSTPGACEGQSTITRTWTATDKCGNKATHVQTIQVVDTTDPTLSGDPPDIAVECDAVPNAQKLTASDNCDDSVPVAQTQTKTPGSCPGNYLLQRTWSTADDCGNDASVSQLVTVQDTKPPTVSLGNSPSQFICDGRPVDFILKGKDNCGSVELSMVELNYITSNNRDRVTVVPQSDGTVKIHATGPAYVWGIWEATDQCGNLGDEFSFSLSARIGREACSQGFWKNHYERWGPTGYSPSDLFVEAFGITDFSSPEIPASFKPSITLEQALQDTGGTFNQAMIQGIAALLNASHPTIEFPATPTQVKQVMRAAFAGDITFAAAVQFFNANNGVERECGCPVQ